MSVDESSADRNVQIWKVKKLIKSLEAARGYAFVVIGVNFGSNRVANFWFVLEMEHP